MAIIDFLMPKMGESVMEATVLKWFKTDGEAVEIDETILEIGTDKVDTEIPSPHSGFLKEILVSEGEIAQIGQVIAKFEVEIKETCEESNQKPVEEKEPFRSQEEKITSIAPSLTTEISYQEPKISAGRFYSPLVLNICQKEGIDMAELNKVPGSGKEGRVTKKDILSYIKNKPLVDKSSTKEVSSINETSFALPEQAIIQIPVIENSAVEKPAETSFSGDHDIVEMSRMRKIIAERMLESKRVSAHVSSFVEADVTNLVYWRNRWKQHFKEKESAILTLTPIFIEAVVKALKDYPMMNVSVSVSGDKILVKKDINIGFAVALSDGNLVVPVIKNADQLNLVGLTKKMNDLAKRARQSKLKPEELEDGTYTVSNVGSFGNVMGTPILVQPQVGILALGAVVKKPAVVETPQGDAIAIRHMMFLSHSYDHRVVDGSLGGMFVRRVADHLERYDLDRKI